MTNIPTEYRNRRQSNFFDVKEINRIRYIKTKIRQTAKLIILIVKYAKYSQMHKYQINTPNLTSQIVFKCDKNVKNEISL